MEHIIHSSSLTFTSKEKTVEVINKDAVIEKIDTRNILGKCRLMMEILLEIPKGTVVINGKTGTIKGFTSKK